jgi:hypothetical protein
MGDYRAMFDRDYLAAFDLEGKPVVVKIRDVKSAELTAQGGRKSKKPVVYFDGKEKGLALNKTNANIIKSLYGADTDGWIGKRITLYATEVEYQGDTVPAIRIRKQAAPTGGAALEQAKGSAWSAFKRKHEGKGKEELQAEFVKTFEAYFGHYNPTQLGYVEWQRFEKDGFVKAGSPLAEDTFKVEDIPF